MPAIPWQSLSPGNDIDVLDQHVSGWELSSSPHPEPEEGKKAQKHCLPPWMRKEHLTLPKLRTLNPAQRDGPPYHCERVKIHAIL